MTLGSGGVHGSIPTGWTQWDSSWPELAGKEERYRLFSYVEDRFGIPTELFDDFLLFRRKQHWLILKESFRLRGLSHLKIEKAGMRAFQRVGGFVKPSTRFIQAFGHHATKAWVEIDRDQLEKLVQGEELPLGLELEKGYVILCLKDKGILGVGFYISGALRSQLPHKELGWTTGFGAGGKKSTGTVEDS